MPYTSVRTRRVIRTVIVSIASIGILTAWVAPAAAAGAPYWGAAVVVEGPSTIRINGAASTSDGHVMIVGTILPSNSTATFPTGPSADDSIVLTHRGSRETGFVARYDVARSAFDWATLIITTNGYVEADSVAVSSDDSVFLTGRIEGTAYLPHGVSADDSIPVTALGNRGAFVAGINPGETVFSWGHALGGTGSQPYANPRAAVSDSGDLIVTSAFSGTGYFPSGPNDDSIAVAQAGAQVAGYIARIDPQTSYVTAVQQVSSPNGIGSPTSAGGPDDSTVVAGTFNQSATFPTGPASDDSIVLTSPREAVYVGVLNSDDSAFAWVQKFTYESSSLSRIIDVRSVAVTSTGGVVATGTFNGATSFPTGPNADDSILLFPRGGLDSYVAKFNDDDSYVDWVIQGGGGGVNVESYRIMVTSDDSVIVSGSLTGLAYFPTGPAADDSLALSTSSGRDTFVVAVSADDSYVSWGRTTRSTDSIDPNAAAITTDDSIVIAGTFHSFNGPAEFPTGPAADDSIVLRVGGSWENGFVAVLGAVPVPSGGSTPSNPPSSPPVSSPGSPESVAIPPSEPAAPVAIVTEAAVSVTWQAPDSPGSFPVSTYQVRSTPGGGSCLTSELSCEVTGLEPGVDYTFTVRALSGAGWSAVSEPSNTVTVVVPTITITGERKGKRLIVSGQTTGLEPGTRLTPWTTRQSRATIKGRHITVADDGTFTWSRRASKKMTWQVRVTDGNGTRSNIIVFR